MNDLAAIECLAPEADLSQTTADLSRYRTSNARETHTMTLLRDCFPEYYPQPEQYYKDLMSRSLIVFDASVLLNVYRYSPASKELLLRIMNALSERLWLPHQACLEFHRNRLTVIDDQTRSYIATEKQIDTLLASLESPRAHPFISTTDMRRTKQALNSLKRELDSAKTRNESLFYKDEDLDRLVRIFRDRIGAEPSDEERAAQQEEAARRIEKRVPPGFRDTDKEPSRSTGDAVLWLQILHHAAKADRPVILVTDDAKDDWWLIVRGKTIGPRPELVKEFTSRTGQCFHLYPPDRFMEFAAQTVGEDASAEAIKEARTITDERLSQRSGGSIDRALLHHVLARVEMHMRKNYRDIRRFLDIIESVPGELWTTPRDPMRMPARLVFELSSYSSDLLQVVSIARELKVIPDEVWVSAMEFYYRPGNRIEFDIMTMNRLRRIPDECLAFVEWFAGTSPPETRDD